MRRDAVVGAAVALAVLGSTLIQDDVDGGRQLTVVGAALILLSGGVLALGGRYPVLVAAVTLACSAIYYPFVGTGGPMLVTFIIALYYVSASGRVVVAAAFAAVCVVAIAVGEKFSPVRHLDNIAQFMLAGWMVAMIALGVARNTRRAYAEEASKRATTEERLRIARELHDVLAHNISLINVQASAALHRKNHTAGLWEALEAIKQASKEALREVRATLGVLRAVDESAPTGPPGLHQLPELVRRTRQTGVEVTVDGEPRALPPEIDLAAYRIIQEALTNVTRHASARSVHVRITYGDKDMSVQVDDDGRGGSLVPGNGIRGMTERAQALGGSLTVRGDDHGVQVAASLPLGAAE